MCRIFPDCILLNLPLCGLVTEITAPPTGDAEARRKRSIGEAQSTDGGAVSKAQGPAQAVPQPDPNLHPALRAADERAAAKRAARAKFQADGESAKDKVRHNVCLG